MKSNFDFVRTVSRAIGIAIAILWCIGNLTNSLADTRQYQRAGTSSVIALRAPMYAADGVAFAQMDEDSREEFVTVERIGGDPSYTVATISTWNNGTRKIEWQSQPLLGLHSMVVGNVDDDSMHELVLFGDRNDAGPETLKVIQWSGSSYRTTGSETLSARLGALGDVDGDGRNELVLSHVPDPTAESGATEPATLLVAKYHDSGFEVIHQRDMLFGANAMAVGDLNGDGRAEIATCERTDGYIDGHITIYTVVPEHGIEVLFASGNRFVTEAAFERANVTHLGIFNSGGKGYVLIEHGKEAWKSAFRLVESQSVGLELVGIRGDRARVYADGLRSTMAYSVEHGAYVRFLDPDTIEFVQE